MEIEEKLVYEPPQLEEADSRIVLGDVVPGATQAFPPDDDPDF